MSVKVSISSAADLLSALDSHDMGLRLAVQQRLVQAPQKALDYGAWQGRDVIDLLVAQGGEGDCSSAQLACRCLMHFEQPRVVDFFLDRLLKARGQVLEAATMYLLQRTFPRPAAFAALLQNDDLTRVRLSARVLGLPQSDDPSAVALRLALVHSQCSLPLWEGVWVEGWLSELQGALAPEARAALQEVATPEQVLIQQARLGPENLRWLAGWAVPRDARLMVAEVRQWLREDPGFALGLLAECPAALDLHREHLPYQHEQARWRDWARRLVGFSEDWKVQLERLHDQDWRVRAEATRSLVEAGPVVVEAVKPLVQSPQLALRVAAAQILSALGEEAWLQANLPKESN